MFEVGGTLLVSEPKIKFAVPIKVTHYADYLAKRDKADYGPSCFSTAFKNGRTAQVTKRARKDFLLVITFARFQLCLKIFSSPF